ncbi:MAG: hypothetical protein ACRC14_00455, partial [Paracoccaceae bacterium]
MRLVTLICALLVGATAVQADTQVIRKLKACGVEAKNSFGAYKEYPAINEGGGYVGFQTEEDGPEGTEQRYSLVNCATRTLVQAKASYKLKEAGKNQNMTDDMFGWIDGLRTQGLVANEAAFSKRIKNSEYTLVMGNAPKPYTDKARRTDCG